MGYGWRTANKRHKAIRGNKRHKAIRRCLSQSHFHQVRCEPRAPYRFLWNTEGRNETMQCTFFPFRVLENKKLDEEAKGRKTALLPSCRLVLDEYFNNPT
jgi:hypothetical protein